MKLPLALVALLLAAPLAAAHVDSFSQSRSLPAGPFLVFFEPRPAPPFAEHASSLVVQVSDGNTGSLLRDVDASVVVAGPADFSARKELESDGTGYQIASMVFPAAGNYSARVLLRDAENNTHSADTEFEVFPNLPFRIRAVDQALDVYQGQRTRIAFEVVDPLTISRKDDAFSQLTVRVEHWTEDHAQFLGEVEVEAEDAGTGLWRIDHTFEETGMHHLRFASAAGGFNYAEVPLLHVYVLSTQQAGLDGEDGVQTPGAGALLVLLALLGATLLLRKR